MASLTMGTQPYSCSEPVKLLTGVDTSLDWNIQVSGASTASGSDLLKDFSRQQSAFSELGGPVGLDDLTSGELALKPVVRSPIKAIQPPPGFEEEHTMAGGGSLFKDLGAASQGEESIEDISGKIQELQQKLELLKLQQEEQVQLSQLRKLREQLRKQQQAIHQPRPFPQPEQSEEWIQPLASTTPAVVPAHVSATAPPALQDGVNWDGVVTVMMRNLPNKYTQQKLKVEIDEAGFAGAYDFLYVPMDKQFGANKGYAFINFLDNRFVHSFRTRFEGRCMSSYKSGKIVQISPASLQGFEANYEHFSNSSVIRGDPKNRPLFIRKSLKGKCLASEPAPLRSTMPPPVQLPYPTNSTPAYPSFMPGSVAGRPPAPAPAQPGHNLTRKFCTSCGERLNLPAARFCTSCGDRIY
eukprot:TRINITY_DN62334_c0_g1_i1.p1 TRINITY_DN62334_c0_g1~~TRINITY_DN62334_c0_g1_i1.p1  ORF type:complete len:411 (-),score=111.17 TRINITY_DN62334_c0_g1_i1:138-1370(-)